MTDKIQERMRAHVNTRGGPHKDDDGKPAIKNGAWVMMLEAADRIDALETERDALRDALREIVRAVKTPHTTTYIERVAVAALAKGESHD